MKYKREIVIGVLCFVFGILVMTLYAKYEITKNNNLTKRIIKTSLKNIQANHTIAESCANAYDTVTNCLSNLSSCNLQQETKKLDMYEHQKEKANQQMKEGNQQLEAILKDL